MKQMTVKDWISLYDYYLKQNGFTHQNTIDYVLESRPDTQAKKEDIGYLVELMGLYLKKETNKQVYKQMNKIPQRIFLELVTIPIYHLKEKFNNSPMCRCKEYTIKPLKEGPEKKGGINQPPENPRPNITPSGQTIRNKPW